MVCSSMFIEIHTLPRAKRQVAAAYRQVKAGVCQDSADMGGHVIAPLGIMAKYRVTVLHQAAEKGFDIIGVRVTIQEAVHELLL